jgi:putative flippase GtrA
MQGSQQAHEHGRRGLLSHFIQHMRDDWPATVFVAALFAILDSHVGWLDAINGHAFVAIGNLAGIPQESGAAKAKALVVVIDQAAAEARYLDRSPLDRCQLLADLGAVYSAMDRRNQQGDALRAKAPASSAQRLDLLAVDLDLSPAPWLATVEGQKSAEAQCERDLHWMIAQANSQWRIRTVLMNPFESVDFGVQTAKAAWKKDMEGSAVTFGRAVLPVEYGLVIKQYCAPDAMAVTAYDLWRQRKRANNEAHEVNECIEAAGDPARNTKGVSQHIDPRRYLSGVVPLAASAQPGFNGQLDRALGTDASPKAATGGAEYQAVFFGAAYGEGDTFVTPLGELYGVEIHAASFLSFLDPLSADNHLAELLADIVFGFVFGFVIAFFWEQYFRFRLSDDSDRRLIAPVVLGGLGVAVALVAFVLTFVSWLLLARFGIWSSPIPMAIGMLIESFVSGSVAQGIREADSLKGGGRPPRQTFRESARKFFGGSIVSLLQQGRRLSATLLTLRLGVWVTVVAVAFMR